MEGFLYAITFTEVKDISSDQCVAQGQQDHYVYHKAQKYDTEDARVRKVQAKGY